MAIVSTDIVFRLSGGASNTAPASSIGGAMSTVAGGIITSGVANNLWDNVAGDETTAGTFTEYRAAYVQNAHGTLTLQGTKFWIDSLTSSADTEFDVGLSAQGLNTTITAVANEGTAPATVTFTRPTTKSGGLTMGNIPAGQNYGFWVRRTVNQNAAAASDTGSVRAEGDTDP